MRDIKFRAWVDDSMWNVNGLAQSDGSDEMDLIDHSIGGYDEVHLYDYTKDCILMQYTGLKDRNSKEIYEGDIIEIKHPYKDRYYKGKIIFEYGSFIAENFFFGHLDNPNNFIETLEFAEVIGNIYETPELLEVQP